MLSISLLILSLIIVFKYGERDYTKVVIELSVSLLFFVIERFVTKNARNNISVIILC